jgi:hypothetical protein
MFDSIKLIPATIAVGAATATFGVGVFFMLSGNPKPVPLAPRVGPVPVVDPPAVIAAELPAAVQAPKQVAIANPPVVPEQGWTLKTMFGLPSPRKLTKKEKAGLQLLGSADDTHTYKFNRMTLDDGSTIPGTPAPNSKEIKDRVVGPIKKLGLADGFEAAVIDLAPRGLSFLTVQVSTEQAWTEVEPVVGKPDGQSEDDVWLKPPTGRGQAYYRIGWFRYGWLEFGVGQGKVRVIRADMRHAEVVAAETIPGGRSPADPAKAKSAKKHKQHRSPTDQAVEVDALQLLGRAKDVKVTTRRSLKQDSQLDQLVKSAESLNGKDVYPGAIETARRLKQSLRSEYLVFTPTANVTINQIQELLGDPFSSQADTGVAKSQRITWHRYHWLEFGTVGSKVVTVRLNCMMTPNYGL